MEQKQKQLPRAMPLGGLLMSENPMVAIYARYFDMDISFSKELGVIIRMVIHAEMMIHYKYDKRDVK